MNNRWTISTLVFLVTLALGAPAQAEPSPRDLIMGTTEQLVEALQEHRGEIRQNRTIAWQIADETVIPLIDFPGIARSVLASHWLTASEEQRLRFTRTFRRLLESVYITAMTLYADEIISHAKNISYPPLQLSDGSREAVVQTLIDLRGGLKVEVNYRMHLVSDSWKIHDVSVMGISLATIYRSTFAREIRRRGLDGLIIELETRGDTAPADSPLFQ